MSVIHINIHMRHFWQADIHFDTSSKGNVIQSYDFQEQDKEKSAGIRKIAQYNTS
jgi:hypothetical protein